LGLGEVLKEYRENASHGRYRKFEVRDSGCNGFISVSPFSSFCLNGILGSITSPFLSHGVSSGYRWSCLDHFHFIWAFWAYAYHPMFMARFFLRVFVAVFVLLNNENSEIGVALDFVVILSVYFVFETVEKLLVLASVIEGLRFLNLFRPDLISLL